MITSYSADGDFAACSYDAENQLELIFSSMGAL